MSPANSFSCDRWPHLSYPDFAATQYLLHMGLQVLGKLKLEEPFQPQWAEAPLWLTGQGLTTGPIPYADGAYEIRTDFVSHQVECITSWGFSARFGLEPMSVARLATLIFDLLHRAGVEVSINLKPQEVPNPVPFDQDETGRPYDSALVNRWWRILLSTKRVMQVFQGRFQGKTQPIGLMWGTLDIRNVLYNGNPASPGMNADYIRRNAMNAELIEMGWWSGNVTYPKPAFYCFTYPQPNGIEKARVSPPGSRWEPAMGEFLWDYDDLCNSTHPDEDLLSFFESTYQAGATLAGWDPELVGSGKPG
jgi:Family of unknown function (DUF5996)